MSRAADARFLPIARRRLLVFTFTKETTRRQTYSIREERIFRGSDVSALRPVAQRALRIVVIAALCG